MQEKSHIEKSLKELVLIESELKDNQELLEIVVLEKDDVMAKEIGRNLEKIAKIAYRFIIAKPGNRWHARPIAGIGYSVAFKISC